jgi:glucose/arabinose dehydrogenase
MMGPMRVVGAVVVAVAAAMVGVVSAPTEVAASPPGGLVVRPIMAGLDHPWDLAFTADGTMFVTERPGRLWARLADGTTRQLSADLGDLWVSGETGLLAIEADPDFATNRRLYTCQGTTDNDLTVQVVAWTVNAALTSLTRVSDPLVGGIDGTSGRHGGCQLRVDAAGALRIGTGDAAFGTNPQNLGSLAGKTLRVDRFTGAGVSGNPFAGSPDPNARRVFTYGHRNVQALALRPGTADVWSVEHGSFRDDEVNRLVSGGNYGWNPVPLPYNEAVPMTAPGGIAAAWSSGPTTIAPSGATFLSGGQWGSWQGALAVSVLKDQHVRLMFFDGAGQLAGQAVPAELNRTYGRIRAAETGPGGALFLTTDNGSSDFVLAVSPGAPGCSPGVASPRPGAIEMITRGGDAQAWRRSWTGSAWTAWTSLGGVLTSEPDLSSWGAGRLDVVGRGTDGALYHNWFDAGRWWGWEPLGGVLSGAPGSVSWSPGRYDVFVTGADSQLWHRWWDAGLGWSGWESLGGQLTSKPAVSSWGPGRIDVVARGTDGALHHRWFDGGSWWGWESLGGVAASGPTAVSWGPNRLDIFVRGTDGALWGRAWGGSGWTGWEGLGGGLASDPDAASRGPGQIDVFVCGLDGLVYQRMQVGAGWTGWFAVA